MENSEGQTGLYPPPSHGGSLTDDVKAQLPVRLIIKQGYNKTDISPCGCDYFIVSSAAKDVLQTLDPAFEFFPLERVDLPRGEATTGDVWLLHTPHRLQVINMDATGDKVIKKQRPSEVIDGNLVNYRPTFDVPMEHLIIDRSSTSGLHLYSGTPAALGAYWFCSEAFKNAVQPLRSSFDFMFIPDA